MNLRNHFWDQAKGLSILAVVFIHAIGPLQGFPVNTFNYQFCIVSQQLLDFAVGIFLAISGYFSGNENLNSSPQILGFYRKRMSKLLPPYIFWSLLLMLALHPKDFLHLTTFLRDLFLGTGIGIGYFVIVLVQYILLTPVLFRIKTNWVHVFVMIAVALGGRAVYYDLRMAHAWMIWANFPLNAIFFPVWYPFYHLGYWIKQKEKADPSFLSGNNFWIRAGYLIFILISISEGEILSIFGYKSFGASQIKISSMFATALLFLYLISIKHILLVPTSWLTWIGRNSYPIYLSHVFYLSIIHMFVFPSKALIPYVLVTGLATLGLCVIPIYLGRKFLPLEIHTRWLGA